MLGVVDLGELKEDLGLRGGSGRFMIIAALAILLVYGVVAVYHVRKPLPSGIDVATPWRAASDVTFLLDSTFIAPDGEQRQDAVIFDEVFRLIRNAERLVVLDMFLVNDFAGTVAAEHRPLSRELTDALIQRKTERPELIAVLITDPFNTLYGGLESPLFSELREAGIHVVETDLTRLRDPNPFWSGFWRLCCQWFGNSADRGWLPDPVGAGHITLRSYLDLLNFKANHRKTLIVDAGEDWLGLVTSANPHDASSRHSNQALRFRGPAVLDLLATEEAVARFSGAEALFDGLATAPEPAAEVSNPALRIVTEAQIREAVLAMIEGAEPGDALDLAMFYLTQRDVVRAFAAAAARGVWVRILLDPNKGAFGRDMGGIPNRQVAMELMRAGIEVRWCNTRGEQCHSKFLLHRQEDGSAEMLAGSANFTRRNIDNYNLETGVQLRGSLETPALLAAHEAFEALWNNEPGRIHSVPYETYADHSRWRYLVYRFMEATGLSTF